MTISEIRNNAGQVWRILGKRMRWSYEEMRQQTGLEEHQLSAAIGWLACEGKILIDEGCPDGRDFSLSMNLYF